MYNWFTFGAEGRATTLDQALEQVEFWGNKRGLPWGTILKEGNPKETYAVHEGNPFTPEIWGEDPTYERLRKELEAFNNSETHRFKR